MEVVKSSIHRITASTGCGCQSMREYSDPDFKNPLGAAVFQACAKHAKKESVDVIEMVLSELVEKEAKDHKPEPKEIPAPERPNAAARVNAEGELEMVVPVTPRTTVGKVQVRPAGTAARPGAKPSGPQAARTGPVAAPRPTSSVRSASAQPANGLQAALAEDEDESGDDALGDFLGDHDPEKAF